MPRVCTVCKHRDLAAIDQALVAGESLRSVAKRTGTSASAVNRHKRDHLPAKLAKAAEAEVVEQAGTLFEQVKDLGLKALAILKKAEAAEQFNVALGAIREARSTLELLAKLDGSLVKRVTARVGVDGLPIKQDEVTSEDLACLSSEELENYEVIVLKIDAHRRGTSLEQAAAEAAKVEHGGRPRRWSADELSRIFSLDEMRLALPLSRKLEVARQVLTEDEWKQLGEHVPSQSAKILARVDAEIQRRANNGVEGYQP